MSGIGGLGALLAALASGQVIGNLDSDGENTHTNEYTGKLELTDVQLDDVLGAFRKKTETTREDFLKGGKFTRRDLAEFLFDEQAKAADKSNIVPPEERPGYTDFVLVQMHQRWDHDGESKGGNKLSEIQTA